MKQWFLLITGMLILSGCTVNFLIDNESAAVKGSGQVTQGQVAKEEATQTVDVKPPDIKGDL